MASKKKKPGDSSSKRSKAPRTRARPVVIKAAPAQANFTPQGAGSQALPPVVGIVASAGGLDAFQRFFAAMPASSGMAFVLIPHLDPTHKSLMVELIARHTAMPVIEATEGLPVQANHVYIIPPNKYLAIAGGLLGLIGPVERRSAQTSLDHFLLSLAEDQQNRAICIILSGTGSHGTPGLKAVKANGGMVMVQEPGTAEYDFMPRSAIASGLADYVLPVEQMPEALIKYGRHAYRTGDQQAEAADADHDDLKQILALLRGCGRCDFRPYRKKMLLRRIERRIGLNHLNNIGGYVKFLRDHPDELKHLSGDLLITVTSFFRDPQAMKVLEAQAIPELLKCKEPDAPLRVWVPACATGEEAYSIAMVLLEQLGASQKNHRVQVFGTDVDEDSLAVARQGRYSAAIAADVSPERISRFFDKVDEHSHQVNKQLREAVVFAAQNLIADAPFSKLDLISCRNLLIYLEAEVQQKVIALFHFALNEGGYLLLGSSETIGRHTDLFEPVSKKWRVYQRIGPMRRDLVEFPVFPGETGRAAKQRQAPAPLPPASYGELTHRLLLEDYAPAAVLVSGAGEILYFHGPTANYLDLPAGEPTRDLMRMAREGLRAKVQAALHKSLRDQQPVVVADARVRREGSYVHVRVTVRPVLLPRAHQALVLVVFQDMPRPTALSASRAETAEEPLLQQLERDLKGTREDLQSTIEELESSNEELKAANEEVMSTNEEFQSAIEELETSKEELQSLNEELTTVNNQLQDKLAELEATNNDIANLLNSTDMATIFLGIDGRIRRFTPATTKLFHLISTDLGRPMRDFAQRFMSDDLERDCKEVLRSLIPQQREVQTNDETWFIRRILPYRTLDNRIDGVVVTFAEVTQLKQAEVLLRRNKELQRLATVLMDSNDAVTLQNFDGTITDWNQGAEWMYGYTREEALCLNAREIVPDSRRAQDIAMVDELRRGGGESWETQRIAKDGSILDVWITATALKNEDGEPVSIGTTERDITVRKRLEKEVLEVAALEQRRIGQELHDSTGQELTGLGLMAESLVEKLREGASPSAELAAKVATGIRRVLREIRVLSRGLIPVEVDTEGLSAALEDLAARICELHQVKCTFHQDEPVHIADGQRATHVYRITQEAIANALNHGDAKHITISLLLLEGRLTLSVRDDGIGIPRQPTESKGMGLRIMRYRAGLINGALSVEQSPGGGTLVSCTFDSDNGNDKE